jgi:hypothetical protein
MIRDMASTEIMYRYFKELSDHSEELSELEEDAPVMSDIKDIELHNYQRSDGQGTPIIEQIRQALQERRMELLRSIHKVTHQSLFVHDRISELGEKQDLLIVDRKSELRKWRNELRKRHIPRWIIDHIILEPKWKCEKQYHVLEMMKNEFGWWLAELDRRRAGLTQQLAEVDNEYLRRIEILAVRETGNKLLQMQMGPLERLPETKLWML